MEYGTACWIAPYPLGCQESWRNGGLTTCERGNNATLYIWLFDLIPKWSAILLVTINMWLIHRSVRLQESKTKQYRIIAASTLNNKKKPSLSKRLARQSYLYVGALYITYIPVIMTRLTQLIAGVTFYGMILTIALLIPMQGWWNLLVYLRPRYLKARNRRRHESSSSDGNINGSFFRAVSDAVREGDIVEQDEEGSTQEMSQQNASGDDGECVDNNSHSNGNHVGV